MDATECKPARPRSPRLALATGLAFAPLLAHAAAQPDSLLELSLEELGAISVTTVSRQPQPLAQSPSAIQVITRDDIRRSGATSIPEALRLATNLQVAQADSQKWVITARGFSSDVGNKLLVMMDGRTLYTPLFSGVFWERQDYVMEDIERIEVVSGPGSTLWGSNAVNGVINIITRSAADTRGAYVEAGGGDELNRVVSARYGTALGRDADLRLYARRVDRDGAVFASGVDAHNGWDMSQGGFRLDAAPGADDNYTLQGDIYRNDAEISSGRNGGVNGLNLLGRWTHRLAADSDAVLQLYYDRTDLTLPVPATLVNNTAQLSPGGTFGDRLETTDADFQHSLGLAARHRVVWGLAYRNTHDSVTNAPSIGFFPAHFDQELYSVFAQDDFSLVPERLILTAGSKFEHNDYTGWEIVPSARLQWNVAAPHMLWAAVSRAVRIPSRIDRDLAQPSQPYPPFNIILLRGDKGFDSEKVRAWEAGYRGQLSPRLVATASLFYNDYYGIRSTTLSAGASPFPLYFENDLVGETHGIELTASYQASDWWRLSAGYNLLKEDMRVKRGGFDFNNALNETADPEHQMALRSSMDITPSLALDLNARWVDDLVINNAGKVDEVPGYAQLNVRLGWTPSANLEVSVSGQNLLDGQHPEFGRTEGRIEIERSVYARLAWRY